VLLLTFLGYFFNDILKFWKLLRYLIRATEFAAEELKDENLEELFMIEV
jgi:hypothetical protein